MLELYYVRPETVDRIRCSWISGTIESYVGWLSERRYSSRTVSCRIPLLVRFGDFARDRGAQRVEDLPNHVEAFVASWLRERGRWRKKERRRQEIAKSVRTPIQQMLRLVLADFVPPGRRHKPENAFFEEAPGFFNHLREEKGLRPRSLEHYTLYLRQFRSYLESIGLKRLGELSPPVLSGFVTEFSRRVQWASLRNACGVLRVFLRYLYREGVLERDLSLAVQPPQSYRLSNLPRSIT